MPLDSRIAAQDPSLSPTYGLSADQTTHAIAPSLRRNLFSAHLSRRPVSNPASVLFRSPSPTHQNAPSHHDVFSSGLTLHPTKRTMDLKDIYDPTLSPPNHGGSPSSMNNLFPRESVIAVNPLTGRPLLPNLPTLPPRLRLSNDDNEREGASDEELEHHAYLEYGRPYSQSPSRSRNFVPSSDFDFDTDIDLDSSDLNFIGIPRGQNVISSFMDVTDDEESRRDRERIERLLAEMMNRQRARARTLVPSDSTNNLSMTASTSAGTPSASRATREGKGRERKMDNPPPRFGLQRTTAEAALGGVGATMDPIEKDELMGLIMTSLRRKLQQAEEEGWMYGGAEGLGGIGMSTELGRDGVYE